MTLPYIEQTQLWEQWDSGNPEFTTIEIFICPSDPPEDLFFPHLSYVAIAGYIANVGGIEDRANGVFFDHTRTAAGDPGPADERDAAGSPLVKMTSSFLQAHDGLSRTLLLTENNRALYWGYVSPEDQQTTLDRKYHFGFCWEQPVNVGKLEEYDSSKSLRRINGNYEPEPYRTFQEMRAADGFPSSYHPGGVHVVMAGGSVKFVSEAIDPLVYAQLMTSDHSSSDLVDSQNRSDLQLEQPADEDY